ncbi:MAG: hypothetical protein ACK4OO_00300 [bacterium]
MLLSQMLWAYGPLSSLGWGWESISSAKGNADGFLVMPDTLFPHPLLSASWRNSSAVRFNLRWSGFHNINRDRSGSDRTDDLGWKNLVVTLPIGHRLAMGLSLQPLTRLSYRWSVIQSRNFFNEDTTEVNVTWEGKGGLTQTLLGIGINGNSQWSLGLAARSITGKVERRQRFSFPNKRDWANALSIQSERVEGWAPMLSWTGRYGSFAIGGWISSAIKLQVERQQTFQREGTVISDTTIKRAYKADYPWEWALGISRSGSMHHWGLTGEVHQWERTSSLFGGEPTTSYNLSFGWLYLPVYRPLEPFYRSWALRGSIFYNRQYLLYQGEGMGEVGGEAGIGIPVARGRIRLDWGIMGGRTTKLKSIGLTQTRWVYSLNILYQEFWFEKQVRR